MRSENSGSKEDFGQIMSILACSSYEISYDFRKFTVNLVFVSFGFFSFSFGAQQPKFPLISYNGKRPVWSFTTFSIL